MKWIGQHIYDQISRFRNDIYLEGLSTTTETSALVVDSDGKISKNVTSGVNMTDGADNRVVTAVGTNGLLAETYLTFVNNSNISTLKLVANESDGADYCTIATTTNGATTITTVDDDFALANMTLTADGSFNINSVGGATVTSAGMEIANGSTTGATALLIDNDDIDQNALKIEAANTTAAILNLQATALTSAYGLLVNCDSLTTGSAIRLDVDDALTASATKTLLDIDYDKAGVTASGQTSATTGISVNIADGATNHASGAVTMIGAQIDIDSANAQGNITKKGLVLNVAADGVADTARSSGIEMEVVDGGTDIKMMSHADTSDYCTIGVTTNGATTITTVDAGATAAHFEIAADGDITLDSAGQIKLEPVAGNNILLDGTVTVDGGSVTGITTLGVDSVSLTAIQTASESFVDNDTSVMTSAAINDAIIKGGDVTYINILPHEFLADEGGGANKSAQYDDSDAGGGTVDIGVSVGSTSASLFAFVDIPVGKTATHVTVYGSNTGNAITVYESNVKTGTLTSKGSGSTDTGDDSEAINITDVAGTSTNYLVIKSAIAAVTNTIWGAQVTVSG